MKKLFLIFLFIVSELISASGAGGGGPDTPIMNGSWTIDLDSTSLLIDSGHINRYDQTSKLTLTDVVSYQEKDGTIINISEDSFNMEKAVNDFAKAIKENFVDNVETDNGEIIYINEFFLD